MASPQRQHYTTLEYQDAQRTLEINELLNDLSVREQLISELNQMLARTPADYCHSFEENGVLHIKFWDAEEFANFCEVIRPKQNVVWLQNAYARCAYFLTFIHLEQGNLKEALTAAQKGLELEPDNPELLNEVGMIYATPGKEQDLQNAMASYHRAFKAREYNTGAQYAHALRGMGFCSIERGEFENAKKFYELSLKFDESINAYRQLAMIKELAE